MENSIQKVKPTKPKQLRIGQWFPSTGWGLCIMTERGFVVVDTRSELEEEFNILRRS